MSKPTPPPAFKGYAYLEGTIKSAPLDMASQLQKVIDSLRGEGWNVAVADVGHDFEGPGGVPVPRDQPIKVWMGKAKISAIQGTNASEAEAAFSRALAKANMGYSSLSRWEGEVFREVIQPSLETIKIGAIPVLGIGLGIALLVLLGGRR